MVIVVFPLITNLAYLMLTICPSQSMALSPSVYQISAVAAWFSVSGSKWKLVYHLLMVKYITNINIFLPCICE